MIISLLLPYVISTIKEEGIRTGELKNVIYWSDHWVIMFLVLINSIKSYKQSTRPHGDRKPSLVLNKLGV